MKSIIGNAVNLSIAGVRFNRIYRQQIRSYIRMFGRRGEGTGRTIGNADSACGILMAVLVTSCAFGFVYVFTRSVSREGEHTRLLIAFPWSIWERLMANI